MKKYTIKEFAEGKKAVKIENEEQWNKLNKVHELCKMYSRNIGHYFNNIHEWCEKDWYERNGYETLEFSQLDFEDEFVLPEKWCVFSAQNKIITDWFDENKTGSYDFKELVNTDLMFCYPAVEKWIYTDNPHSCSRSVKPDGYTEITFDQFKTHVLKESTMQEIKEGSQFKVSRESDNTIYTFNRIEGDNVDVTWGTAHRVHYYLSNCLDNIKDGSWILVNKEKTMEKEIIGYKLIKPEFIDAANSLLINSKFVNPSIMNMHQACNIEVMRKAGVLDLWFEPVYAPQIQLPTINGYQGSYKSSIIKYGCAEFSKMFFEHLNSTNSHLGNRTIKSIKLSSDVEITIEEIKQIVEYINKK